MDGLFQAFWLVRDSSSRRSSMARDLDLCSHCLSEGRPSEAFIHVGLTPWKEIQVETETEIICRPPYALLGRGKVWRNTEWCIQKLWDRKRRSTGPTYVNVPKTRKLLSIDWPETTCNSARKSHFNNSSSERKCCSWQCSYNRVLLSATGTIPSKEVSQKRLLDWNAVIRSLLLWPFLLQSSYCRGGEWEDDSITATGSHSL